MIKVEIFKDEIMIQSNYEEEKIEEIKGKIKELLSIIIWKISELKSDVTVFQKIDEAMELLKLIKEKYDIEDKVEDLEKDIYKLKELKKAWQALKENIKNKNNIIDIGEIVYIERKEG